MRIGYKVSQETRQKMRLARLGKKRPDMIGNQWAFKKGMTPWNKGMIGLNTGEKNPAWKGDNVGYFGLHYWVKNQLGSPSVCSHCKRIDKKKYEWANISEKYKRDLNDWIRLCTSCHRKYDYNKKKISYSKPAA